MKYLYGQRVNSDAFDRNIYNIFQIVYYFFQNGSKKTLLHVIVIQDICNESRSKKIIIILNWLDLSISYNKLERNNYILANSLLERSG